MSGDVVIIGAGPAGITAGWRLACSGTRVTVVEASGHVGGLARTIPLWAGHVDLGPHRFFSTNRRVNEAWLEAVGPDYVMVDRTTRILYQGRLFDYPLKPANALRNLGVGTAAACLGSYARARLKPPSDTSTFEGWVTSRFGKRLYEIFFKTYSEKLWGIPCSALDADFAAQRIKGFSLGAAVRAAVRPSAGKSHKTLADRFAYPVGGAGRPYERMADAIQAAGGEVRLNAPVDAVVRSESTGAATGVRLHDGSVLTADHIVSSMPITTLVTSIKDVPGDVLDACRRLRFRNTILVFLDVEAANLFPDQWIYVHDPRILMGRLTNFSNWHESLVGNPGSTVVAGEYWANDDDPLWHEDDSALIERTSHELRLSGLIGSLPITRGHVHRIHRCYPVYERGYRDPLSRVQDYLSGIPGLSVIGRYGAFKYNNQDHSILMGLLAADNILTGADHDLWAVNTDYDAYQEEARIDETGLVSA